ncbi:hypothetical protein GF327_08615 [Candidatus Woesearchaeota archaeon]|nr:hypothetical protein [Candidatus Woesearchaeota archaeon]
MQGYGYDMIVYLSQQGENISPYHMIVVPSDNPKFVCSVGINSGSLEPTPKIKYHRIQME